MRQYRRRGLSCLWLPMFGWMFVGWLGVELVSAIGASDVENVAVRNIFHLERELSVALRTCCVVEIADVNHDRRFPMAGPLTLI